MTNEYKIHRTPNGGWVIYDDATAPGYVSYPIAAFSTTADMLDGLAVLIQVKPEWGEWITAEQQYTVVAGLDEKVQLKFPSGAVTTHDGPYAICPGHTVKTFRVAKK